MESKGENYTKQTSKALYTSQSQFALKIVTSERKFYLVLANQRVALPEMSESSNIYSDK